MTQVMEGVRILEVAEHTFVPAASALLSEWGADVIKIEHVERGDAMRGLASTGLALMGANVHVLLEHSNRGKRSIGVDLSSQEGIALLYQIATSCDVFLTNKLPGVVAKLGIGVDEIRRHNPSIVYVRGSGQGMSGPEADRGSYDLLSFWHRSGMAMGCRAADAEAVPAQPAPAFGDSVGAVALAGGVMGALYHRQRTGEATVVDVSLLSVGIWSIGAAIALSLETGNPWSAPPSGASSGNPLVGVYRTSDSRWISLSCLQAFKYWPEFCEVVGLPELVNDPRFSTVDALRANARDAVQLLQAAFLLRNVDEWRAALASFSGQWTVVQDTIETAEDPQTIANEYVVDCETADGKPFKLAAAPIRFDETTNCTQRAPEFNEHGDEILESLGLDMDAILDLRIRGVVA
jgi:crotonobetainyl-CoA:carnitine CoA-transferase CaiB-like acyl-CoA transferase